jgi:hypothetical protein
LPRCLPERVGLEALEFVRLPLELEHHRIASLQELTDNGPVAVHDLGIFLDESLRGRERAFFFREGLEDRGEPRPAGRLFGDGHHTSPVSRYGTFVALWWRSSSA